MRKKSNFQFFHFIVLYHHKQGKVLSDIFYVQRRNNQSKSLVQIILKGINLPPTLQLNKKYCALNFTIKQKILRVQYYSLIFSFQSSPKFKRLKIIKNCHS